MKNVWFGLIFRTLFMKTGNQFEFQIDLKLTKLSNSWSQIEIHSNEKYPDSDQSYYSGLIEGYLTEELITNHFNNKFEEYFKDEEEYESKLKNFVDLNIEFMTKEIKSCRESDPYWHTVALVLEQITGLQDGYDLKKFNRKPIGTRIQMKPLEKIFLLNLIPDLDVLEEVFQKKSFDRLLGEGSCSAIVRTVADGSDLLVAHNMWSTYHSMLRMIKKYDFKFHFTPNSVQKDNSLTAGHCMSFSSYPGTVLSLDDFYILSSGLVVQETTFEILNNKDLWPSIKGAGQVLEFIRVLVANRLSNSGKEWTDIFSRYNSGTYNSQFMIIDYKLYHKGLTPDKLPAHLLWVCEQLPDLMVSRDMTQVLRRDHYWASYNVPFFEEVYTSGGYPELRQRYGNYFSHDLCSRAQIFRRDHKNAIDLKSLMRLMRSNDYLNDPLSHYQNCRPNCSAELAIAARNDLNDPNGDYCIPVLGFRPRGAIDATVSSTDLVQSLSMYAVSGPTHQSLPPFEWSKSKIVGIRHEGQPDKWQFDPILIHWIL